MTAQERREYQEWLDLCERIRSVTNTSVPVNESDEAKERRKLELQADFPRFCKFYFSHYFDKDGEGNITSDFGWFHKRAAKDIINDPKVFCVLEWPREHAKSVFADTLMAMFLYANGELTGMMLGSANEKKAAKLLGDVQAELEANQLILHDYGQLVHSGSWKDAYFSLVDGTGFWAFGRGQSPRGTRNATKRPNYGVIDDIDDREIVRNQERVKDAVKWVIEDFYGALSIKGGRMVIAGNRIHKKSILAHLVGDVEPGDPKRARLTHIKVFAFENPKTHGKADAQQGKPAWKERYTAAELLDKMEILGYYATRREFFHEHFEEGLIFKNEWIQWAKPLAIEKYDALVVYTDPSFKETKDADYKATVLLGKTGRHIHILKAWVRQATATAMVKVAYDIYDEVGAAALYFIEANFLQDRLLEDYEAEGEARGYQLPIRGDKRKKEHKEARIENLSPLMERGLMVFSEAERQNTDMQVLVQQFMGFPYAHDDGPDAVEGGTHYLQRMVRSTNFKPRMGKYKRGGNR